MPERTWLQVLSHVDPRFGGIAAVVPRIAEVTGCDRLAFSRPGETPPPCDTPLTHAPSGRLRWLLSPALRNRFREFFRSCSGVHIHGLWEEHAAITARLASSVNKPYIVAAHGMLDRWALRNKQLKKAIYAGLFERPALAGAACLQALTTEEVQNYRDFGLKNPIALIPHGVDLPERLCEEPFFDLYPELRGRRLVLFLGRVHYKKGLDILCTAWARLANSFDDAHLVIAGPDFENTRARIEHLAGSLGISRRLTFAGPLAGELKWSALAASRLFVLPSYSEGFSVAILEAMSAGRPVIASTACHFQEIAQVGAGWVVEPTARELESSLHTALATADSALSELGARGRRLVSERYTWKAVGRQLRELYGWLEGGSRPEYVQYA